MKRIYWIAILLLALVLSCKKENEPQVIEYVMNDVEAEASYTTCTITCKNADIDDNTTHVRLLLAKNENFNSAERFPMQLVEGRFTTQLTGLQENTLYYYSFEIYTTKDSYRVKDVYHFKTLLSTGLVVTTSSVSYITQTSAVGGGSVNSNSGVSVNERGLCWSTTHDPTIQNAHLSNGYGTGAFSVTMTELTPGTRYYVRAYATNAQGTSYGGEVSFMTESANLPEVQTGQITNITSNSAVGRGTVVSAGASNVTDKGLCWSTTSNPLVTGSHTSAGGGVGDFSVTISGLNPNRTYYVRAYATNAQGTAYGAEISFVAVSGLPEVVTTNVTNITSSSATGGGNVTATGGADVTSRGVCWSTSHNPTVSGNHTTNGAGTGVFTSNITGLSANTIYYVRAYATNSVGTVYGAEVSFTTLANIPTVTTSSVNNVTQTTATGGGNVTSNGGANVTARGICWSTSHNPTISNSHVTNGTGTGSFTCNMTGLTANTKYYVRAYATNSAGTAYGSEVSFTTTQNVSVPTVTTSQVTNITQTTATGGGNVTATGGANVTARGVCWSTSHNPTISNSHVTNGTGTGSFTCNMTGLTANTTYYVRAYATNSAGTAYGTEVSFTTLQNVTVPTVTTTAVSNITQTTATGGGNVTATGGANVTARGVCWSTVHNPTINNWHVANGSGTGSFTCNMTGLTANTTYYVRAYATNSAGTAYGSEVSFVTEQVPTYNIVVSSNPTDGGNVSGGGSYQYGASCTVYATANLGYTFTNWTENGGQVSTNANYTFTVNGSRNLVANFTSQGYTISVSANPSSGGYVSGGGSYQYGASCTVYATANSGYTFTNWTENGSQVSTNANYTFTVNGNRSLVANFTYNGGGDAPIGAINGLFTINANGDQVYFSQGNLQYQASTDIWRFATNQWDYVGEDNANISSTYSGWIDLFGWGTSGWNSGNTYYHPWDSNNSSESTYGPPGQYNLTGSYANADWGVYNPISNGGNQANQWRTLTQAEWTYVFNTRSTTSGIRYAKANVNDVNGVILLPDDWSSTILNLSNTNSSGASFSSNTISASQWTTLESAGAVFLPAAGDRIGASVSGVGSLGLYWSASYDTSYGARKVGFNDSGLGTYYGSRCLGHSVRLVHDANK